MKNIRFFEAFHFELHVLLSFVSLLSEKRKGLSVIQALHWAQERFTLDEVGCTGGNTSACHLHVARIPQEHPHKCPFSRCLVLLKLNSVSSALPLKSGGLHSQVRPQLAQHVFNLAI